MAGEGGNCRIDYTGDYESRFHGYHDLMRFKIRDILLVSSLYDAFTLEEDGGLSEQIYGEYQDLDLSSPPRVIRVSSGAGALKELERRQYDLVITMARISDMEPFEFGRKAKAIQEDIPVILLITDASDLPVFHKPGVKNGVDKVFFWSGDSKLFMAITKYVEDTVNAASDTEAGMVRVIIIVENSARYYSLFLPIIYTEIMRQTTTLVAEGLNEHEKLLRRRARPKILLAETYEEAVELYERYKDYIQGIITDVKYPRGGKDEEEAGFQFVTTLDPGVPVLVQSSHMEHKDKAEALCLPFIYKYSETLPHDLRRFLTTHLGFGEFVFKLPGGKEVGRAYNMAEFVEMVKNVPAESLRYHALQNHFSNWLMARGESALALRVKPKKVSDFSSDEDMRQKFLTALRESRHEKQLGVITDFNQQKFEFDGTVTKYGGGSLGGKGRGIAFLNSLIHQSDIASHIPTCKVKVPDTLVIATEEFDRFISENGLDDIIKENLTDAEITRRFLNGTISPEMENALRVYLAYVRAPVAVRSSSLLEDSQNQPFAGIYSTYLIPNNHPDIDVRLAQLVEAVKLVYASAFYRSARAYIQTTVHTSGEEKMAVVIQKLVGQPHGDRFYPMFSGVAQSYNFYPVAPLKREDGITSIALGLGKIVVEGGNVISFSPEHPNVIPGFSAVDEILKNSQHYFYALDMARQEFDLTRGEDETLLTLEVPEAEKDGMLELIASTYDANDNRLRDGVSDKGPLVITFSGILKYNMLPLNTILKELLDLGLKGMGRPVELEFAGCMGEEGPEFYILQIRPLVTMRERKHVSVGEHDPDKAFIYSGKALGNGVLEDIWDVIYVPPETFDKTMTREMSVEIGELNKELDGRPYLLIGAGRWGTRDRFLGIPVEWDQISSARAMVEYSTEDFRIDPSHGTHFFHNITSLGIAYFTIPYGRSNGHIDWDWLKSRPTTSEKKYVRHVQLSQPLTVKVDGRTGKGVVLKG